MILKELILSDDILKGIQAISIVENPAIEEDFITLSKEEDIKLAKVSEERRILMGPALIPERPIYRRGDEETGEYYIYFSKDTIRKASELFLTTGKQNNATLEHMGEIEGLSVVESWLIEDPEKDKSAAYGLSYPKGTWMVSQKVYNEDIWNDYVKTGRVKGFSIEGFFIEAAKEKTAEELADQILNELKRG